MGSDDDNHDGDAEAKSDKRLNWIKERVFKELDANDAKWEKMLNVNTNMHAIQCFFDEPPMRFVLFYKKDGTLYATIKHPSGEVQGKLMYFMKRDEVSTVDEERIGEEVYHGDLVEPLKQLEAVVHEIYMPIFRNKRNREQWPEAVAEEVVQHFYKMAGSVEVVCGLRDGRTVLPLPPDVLDTEESNTEKALIHRLESAVIDWTHQVRRVVSSTSASSKKGAAPPTPAEEVEFWGKKAHVLRTTYAQLCDERMKKIGRILALTQSSYHSAFENIVEETHASLLEACDVYKHLFPLLETFEEMSDLSDSVKLLGLFPTIFSTLTLAWNHSEYLQTAHIVTVMEELTWHIISILRDHEVDGEGLFKQEPPEAILRLKVALHVTAAFKEQFHQHQEALEKASPDHCWNMDRESLFKDLDAFHQRLQELVPLVETVVDFRKLEKVEVGGYNGRRLTAQVGAIFTEFEAAVATLSSVPYDLCDITEKRYAEDTGAFTATIAHLESRLASTLSDAFDECANAVVILNMFESFAEILYRPGIKAKFTKKVADLLDMYDEELAEVRRIFKQEEKAGGAGLPPVSGTISWSRNLRARVEAPFDRIMALDESLHGGASARATALKEKYEELIQLLKKQEEANHKLWAGTIDAEAAEKLALPLLRWLGPAKEEDPSGQRLLGVNFDSALVMLLREVKYMQQLNLEVPEAAKGIFDEAEQFRQFVAALDSMVTRFNGVVTSVLEVEHPLIAGRLDELNVLLEKGARDVSWKSPDVVPYISETTKAVDALHSVLSTLKSNVEDMEDMTAAWSSRPMIDRRKDGNRMLVVEESSAYITARSLEIELHSKRMHDLIKSSKEVCGDLDEVQAAWRKYAEYISDRVVGSGLAAAVETTLSALAANMDARHLSKHDLPPLFEVKLKLTEPNVVFDPPLERLDGVPAHDLRSLFSGLIDAVFNIGALVKPRLDEGAHATSSYHDDLLSDSVLSDLRSDILDRIDSAVVVCGEQRERFLVYQDLWTTDREDYLQSFLRHGKLLSVDDPEAAEEAAAAAANEEEGDGAIHAPTLEDFAHQIAQQDKYAAAVSGLPDATTVHWLSVNFRPFKKSLLSVIGKWRNMFTKHLHDDVANSLSELAQFIKDADTGLAREVGEDNYDLLVETMGLLRTIRDRMDRYDHMFEPLRETIALLKECEVEMEAHVLDQLNDLPQEWTNLKRKMYAVKGALQPLQEAEMSKIKARRATFIKEVERFDADFHARAPFAWNIDEDYADNVYFLLDELNADVMDKEANAADLADREDMFELSVVQYKEIAQARQTLAALKMMWDLVNYVRYEFDEWKATKWREIDCEAMTAESKQFLALLKKLPRDCRAWDVFQQLEEYIKNLMKALSAIGELGSKAMRERHWRQLIRTTGVDLDIAGLDTTVTFQNLLDLKLHNHGDAVGNIVDKAAGELSMEANLADLEKTWTAMHLSFGKHKDVTPVLETSPELMETLEDNMVTLQNMMSSKFVGHFIDKITEWQTRLSAVDTVIHLWLEVQHSWSHLEAIFIDSADIREQLPEDSKRFDRVDKEWKQLMAKAVDTTNVVDACSREGIQSTFETLESELAKCSKALDEYLETKRLAFPRFYFISNEDLLDILAKGDDPQMILGHLFKLFDNLVNLDFEPKEDGTPSTKAVAMYSSEGERVELLTPCVCEGQVEGWLNGLVSSMRKTLRQWLAKAVDDYGETKREEWLLAYPAQIALTGSQVWWTTEVEQAFEKLEEGYESALKEYLKRLRQQLVSLVRMLQGELSKNARQCIMTVCTIDVHNRDVVRTLVEENAESSFSFGWQSQLKTRWDDDKGDCFINICDAEFQYSYEYLGNAGRLVITPLTDRCYITLTQSLHLIMGGAPAGPAGTGKTETTKDLGRALGIRVLVQNCSPQQTYQNMASIFKGLAQSGMWGCFDEFNRISVAVLSVVATQVKAILDGIKAKKSRFMFMDEEIMLVNTVGMFITMNPGYAGRTELPDNLKALFRPVSMVVPDLGRICEIMLMAQGFEAAEELALKFTTLYSLTKELLSDAAHYDWGLRAIKSVLVVAGILKRGEPHLSETAILMRALRDFNLPKIVTEDVQIFLYLINDLFPGIDLDRKVNTELEGAVRQVTLKAGLQTEGQAFVLKVVQLDELLDVRHSVFIIGPSGSGKSQVWHMLAAAYTQLGRKTIYKDINPKAVDTKELFGYKNPVTKEPMDGLFSKIMRDLANIPNDDPKWIVLDGDIDPDWIESLNTVMDDNKVLTLPSNERIQLTNSMRLIFEIGNLKHATPATVSRAGILFINETDIGWQPFVQSWIEKRGNVSEKSVLTVLFERYVPACLEYVRKHFRHVVPTSDFQMVQSLCYMLEGLLVPDAVPAGSERDVYEVYFVFAVVWAMGGALVQDSVMDHRSDFSKWVKVEFRSVKFPGQGSVFDYCIGPDKKWQPWTDCIKKYEHDPDMPVTTVNVETVETVRVRYWLEVFVRTGRPLMLVGNAGVGKTRQVQNVLSNLPDKYMSCTTNFNYYTDSFRLQEILENQPPLEKKVGKDFGPPGSKSLVYFIDDITMPQLDEYETQTPSTLLRQHIDYGHWYERGKWEIKNIKRCQYVACLNPKTGSFNIDPRLQRHFSVLNLAMPGKDSLASMFQPILAAHFEGFQAVISKNIDKLVHACIEMHSKVASSFLPTAVKFHYQFNLRSLSMVVQGLLNANKSVTKTQTDVIQLWAHECRRVYSDPLTSATEIDACNALLSDVLRKTWSDADPAETLAEPLIFSHFAQGVGEEYVKAQSFPALQKVLEEALRSYNDVNEEMDLVLFQDAVEHVARIARVIMNPIGSALLIGVGGSGKQSLARLAASICGYEVFQMLIRSQYGLADLRADLVKLYQRCGTRGEDVVFLLTDAQVIDERFLIYVNDLLSSGDIPGLFAPDEVDGIVTSLRGEVKQAGLVDTREMVWKYFIQKARRHLHVVLCFSPVGGVLRNRYRRFPALVNCTQLDWFHKWPEEALHSVAQYFLNPVDLGESKEEVVQFVAYIHKRVEEASISYRQQYRRFNYTTPKSFLELIKLYKAKLAQERAKIQAETDRLKSGLLRLQGASEQVAKLHEKLAVQQVDLKHRTAIADDLVKQLGKDQNKVQKESEAAKVEEEKTNEVKATVAAKKEDCDRDLAAAEPAIVAAEAALSTFSKKDLSELKALATPPQAVVMVLAAVMILQSPEGRIRRDLSWKSGKQYMNDVGRFYDSLVQFDRDNIPEENIKALKPYLSNKDFSQEVMVKKSVAAAGICAWVINICKYHEVYLFVQPKREALAEATKSLEEAEENLAAVKERLQRLEATLEELTAKFNKAQDEKVEMEQEAARTKMTIDLANRLVGGLGSEGKRWGEEVERLGVLSSTLVGDVLVAAGFISYIGSFNRPLREELVHQSWLPWLQEHKVPLSDDYDPLKTLTSDALVAKWNNEGLPTDRVSLENAAVCAACHRWPLLIDPQLQGILWLKNRTDFKELAITRLDNPRLLSVLEKAIREGEAVILEGVGETLDPVLDPLLGRNFMNKGGVKTIRLGDKVVEYNEDFRLFIQCNLGNPHFKPELQALTTLINFTVTEDGLEDQLLATVVNNERPDLEEQRSTLIRTLNEYEINLKELEASLLAKLQAAEGDFLSDTVLVENLEKTKATALDIQEKKRLAIDTQAMIEASRNTYRPVAARAALLYFLLNDLSAIDHMYQFSLKAFVIVFVRAIKETKVEADGDGDEEDAAEAESEEEKARRAVEQTKARVSALIDSITYQTFLYTTRGLFERHKLIFTTMLCFRVLTKMGAIDPQELNYLLRGTMASGVSGAPLDWLNERTWRAVCGLKELEAFSKLADDIEGSSARWKKWSEEPYPETATMPQDWKNKSEFQKLLVLRALRPDRLINGVTNFITNCKALGPKYTDAVNFSLEDTFKETTPETHMFFILSPGVDPIRGVEAYGRKMGYTVDNGRFKNVSLGQGQEDIAMDCLDYGHKEGAWVILQNIHLMVQWLPLLEKKLNALSNGAHNDFRVFLSAEPVPNVDQAVPIGILQRCIKVTNEPPRGMKANMRRALGTFTQDTLESCSKETEFHTILFTMCFFHAVVLERRKFGPAGWNRPYNFNTGDLTISIDVLNNYLENNTKIPWEDLRYMFGEIMYGGHISDDWDRRLCRTYLEKYIRPELVEEEIELVAGFPPPPHAQMEAYHEYINDHLPMEDPSMFGLGRNAEIGFLTAHTETLFRTILEMQPQTGNAAGAGAADDKVVTVIKQILETLPQDELYPMVDMYARTEDKRADPYVVVALQECERMNVLVNEIKRSLRELELGIKGDLMMSEQMEALTADLEADRVPATWTKRAYPSLKTLGLWVDDLLLRIKQLDKWVQEFRRPTVLWLPGLFNPQSFLTAIMQKTARKNKLPLDKMRIMTEVTKKELSDIYAAKSEGDYVTGLYLEGARWDTQANCLTDAGPKELYYRMPVLYLKAVTVDKLDLRGQYQCPLYKTRQRGPGYVWTLGLRTKHPESKWILSGTALLLST